MSTTTSAAPAMVQRAHSSSRRSQPYTSSSGIPHRASSTASRPPPHGPVPLQRSGSQSHSYNRPQSSSQAAPHALNDVLLRRDFETSNLPETATTRRSTSSRDGAYAPPSATRAETTRAYHRNVSRSGHARQVSDMTNGETTAARPHGMGMENADRTISSSGSSNRRRTTITGQSGEWTLGKTIGAGSMGKVKLAKRLETGEQVAVKIVPRHSVDDGRDERDRERHDRSKEIRTQREAAIVSLLEHPYICGLRDIVRTNFHWYMLFEFVNGGQMLDYIISHGRLKEKQARKFSRQIASALDYCHRNSIVHRDLKIENILISKTGDIKIIDFGLSNLFSPRSHLKTFCGSLYFAAPELLQAKPYTGPEVDVWSFGIVLFVLACGKVPFDDQSMPQLHAKIKKGIVDYPPWLHPECKDLISRMLVTEPRQRATLQEIMTHPWMIKGFSSPVENYLPPREPLQLPLDPAVINGMTGFDFGPSDFITSQLTRVIESDDYQNAVRAAAGRDQSAHGQGGERRRFAAFDFYKRRSSTMSGSTLPNPSTEAIHLGADPVNAYSPLISIYHLVREKQQRQKAESSPGATSMPRSPGEQPLRVPDLPAPVEAHTNAAMPEMPGEAPTGGRTRPRARTRGEDEVTETMKRVSVSMSRPPQPPTIVTPAADAPPPPPPPPPPQPQPKKESTAAGIFRRLSTRRHREPEKDGSGKATGPASPALAAGDGTAQTRKSFGVRRGRNRDGPPISMLQAGGSQPHHQHLLSPPATADARPRRGVGLGRSTSVNSADMRRRSGHPGHPGQHGHHGTPQASPQTPFNEPPPLTSGSDQSSTDGRRGDTTEVAAAQTEDTIRPSTRSGGTTARARSLGHARRESMQARRARRDEAKEAVPEETDQELAASGGSGDVAPKANGAENARPVFLKGLFSVSTTSPKPVRAIRIEIIRVLRQLGVEHNEIRGGFRCRHTPSIDLNRVQDHDVAAGATERGHPSAFTPGGRRRISLGGFIGGGNEKDEPREHQRPPNTPKTPSRRRRHDGSPTLSEGSETSVGRAGHAVGDTTTHVQSELGGNMVLVFEIIIVKVPILALHGLQFKRMSGGTWQYKNMADKILKELRL